MIYKILDKSKGIILSRTAESCRDKVIIEFEDIPNGATAIFEHQQANIKYFCEIVSGKCELPLRRFIDGRITLTVAVLDGSADPQRWQCEGLVLQTLSDGNVLIYPDDGDLPLDVALLKSELCDLRRNFAELAQKFNVLSDKLEKIMEGYDLT